MYVFPISCLSPYVAKLSLLALRLTIQFLLLQQITPQLLNHGKFVSLFLSCFFLLLFHFFLIEVFRPRLVVLFISTIHALLCAVVLHFAMIYIYSYICI